MKQIEKLVALAYFGLSPELKIHFLAGLSNRLTVSMRSCYSNTPQVVSSDVSGSCVVGINELQHHVTAQLEHLILGRTDCPSDVEFVSSLSAVSHNFRCSAALTQACYSVFTSNSWLEEKSTSQFKEAYCKLVGGGA